MMAEFGLMGDPVPEAIVVAGVDMLEEAALVDDVFEVVVPEDDEVFDDAIPDANVVGDVAPAGDVLPEDVVPLAVLLMELALG